MDTSVDTKPSGPAALSTGISPNQETTEESVTLKHAATKYECAASSLKHNIKCGKLPATQENPQSAYLVRLSDVEHFLSSTPGIVSAFHPKTIKSTVAETGQPTCASAVINEPTGAGMESPCQPAETVADHGKQSIRTTDLSVEDNDCRHGTAAVSQEGTEPKTSGRKKRRRRRNRGHVKSAATHEESATASAPFMKILANATPEERFKIMACLNELATMVASA